MRIIRYIIFTICLCLAIYSAIIFGIDYVKNEYDQITEILFSTFCVLATFGILTLLATFFLRAIANTMAMLFFGFFTGITLANIISEILSGITCNSIVGYLTSYGLMVVLLILCVTACCLIHMCPKEKYSSGEQVYISDEEKGEQSTSTAAGQ